MPTPNKDLCALLEVLQTSAYDIWNDYTGKLGAARQLANLLYINGLQVPLPDIGRLIPSSVIDVYAYNQLGAYCPGLLPPFDGISLARLRDTVDAAYNRLHERINVHPFQKLARVGDKVNQAISEAADKFESRFGPAIMALDCAVAICGAVREVGAVPDQVLKQAQSTAQGVFEAGKQVPSVFTQVQQDAAREARERLNRMSQLIRAV